MAKSKTNSKKSKTSSPTPKIPREDQAWMAESDAHTLAEAESIKMDKSRLGRAQRAAGKLAKQAEQRAKAIKKVSKK